MAKGELEVPEPEQTEGQKRIEEQGLQVFSRIKCLSTRQQIENSIEKLSCEEIRMLLQYYQCDVRMLTRKIFDDKVYHRTAETIQK